MGLNCKPGDLAIVVDSRHAKHVIGWVVSVVRIAPPGMVLFGGLHQEGQMSTESGVWVVEVSGVQWLHSDSRLRPLRDSDGTDEMIRIAGLPNKEPSNV